MSIELTFRKDIETFIKNYASLNTILVRVENGFAKYNCDLQHVLKSYENVE